MFNGKGSFPSEEKTVNIKPANAPLADIQEKALTEIKKDKTIDRIVIFYSDGSFKNYDN